MIVADRKPVEEIIGYVENCRKILILGCNKCVTVCETGGDDILESLIRS